MLEKRSIISVLVSITGILGTIATAQLLGSSCAKADQETKPMVTVRLVNSTDKFGNDPNPLPLVQLNSDGSFTSSEGYPIKGDLSGLFYQDEKDRKKKLPVYLLVHVTDKKGTSLSTFTTALDKLRASVKPGTEAVIFVHIPD